MWIAVGLKPTKQTEVVMRKMLLFGTASLVVSFGAVSANAMPFYPDSSPYALMDRQQAQPRSGAHSASMLQEGRGAYAGDDFTGRLQTANGGVMNPNDSIAGIPIY